MNHLKSHYGTESTNYEFSEIPHSLKSNTGFSKNHALQSLENGKNVTHIHFMHDQYITMKEGTLFTKEGGLLGTVNDRFWRQTSKGSWEDGWSIFDEAISTTKKTITADEAILASQKLIVQSKKTHSRAEAILASQKLIVQKKKDLTTKKTNSSNVSAYQKLIGRNICG